MGAIQDGDLFPDVRNPSGLRSINSRCSIRTADGHSVVLVSGLILFHYAATDRMSEAQAMVGLVEQGWANQLEVARAFNCSARTVRRDQRRLEAGGLAALGRGRGYPPGRARLAASRLRWVQELKAKGRTQRDIARTIGVSEKAVRKLLRRLGWKSASPAQDELSFCADEGADPKLSAFPSAAMPSPPCSQDSDPTDRRGDRLLAYLGLLDDAAPVFGSGPAIHRAGVETRRMARRYSVAWLRLASGPVKRAVGNIAVFEPCATPTFATSPAPGCYSTTKRTPRR